MLFVHIINPIPTNCAWDGVGVGPGLGFGLACLLPLLAYDAGMLTLGLLD